MKVWIEKPVTEPPVKEGRYIVTNGFGYFDVQYSERFGFHEEFTDCSGLTHYLDCIESPSPIEVEAAAKETPEDILQKHDLINGFAVEAYTERVVAAMEEYANQFRSKQVDIEGWIKIDDLEIQTSSETALNYIRESYHLIKKNP